MPAKVFPSRVKIRTWVPKSYRYSFKLPKGANRVAGGMIFERDDEMRLLIAVGSAQEFQVGFDVIELPRSSPNDIDIEGIQYTFCPKPVGSEYVSWYHSVQVSAEPQVLGITKYYMVDISMLAIEKVFRPIQAVKEQVEKAIGRHISVAEAEKDDKDIRKKPSFWRRVYKEKRG